jgi:hypothetical protein
MTRESGLTNRLLYDVAPMTDDELRNPFDPTTPCRALRELAGRERETAWFQGALQALKAASPEHALVLGPPQRGKTSLLNAFAELASGDFLVVRVAVNDTVLHEPQRFFLTLLHGAVAALETRMSRQRPRALTATSRPHEPKRFHLQEVDYLDPALLDRDFRSVAQQAARLDLKGVVALCDQADLIREDDALLQALSGAIESLDSWMFVLAGLPRLGDEIRQTYRPLSDRLNYVRLPRLTGLSDVREAISSRIPETTRSTYQSRLSGEAIRDISFATRGEPYRLTLLAGIMWDIASAPGKSEFELSYVALRIFTDVLISQHHPDELPEALLEVKTMMEPLESLPDADLKTLGPLVALQGMTSRECALARLCKDGVTEEVASASLELESSIEDQIRKLESAEVVESEGDRFRIKGGALGRTLLRYRIKDATDELPPFEIPNYGALSAVEFYRRMSADLGLIGEEGMLEPGPVPLAIFTFSDAKVEEAGQVAASMLHDIVQDDPLFIDKSRVDVWAPALTPPSDRDAIAVVGWVMCVMADETSDLELTRLELIGLHWHNPEETADDLRARVLGWLGERELVLREYRLVVKSSLVGVADSQLADAAVAISAPFSSPERSIEFWQRDELTKGLDYLTRVRAALEASIAAGDAATAENLGDCLQRIGFFAACLGEDGAAEEALKGSQALAMAPVQYLNAYNLAFVRALRSQWAAASGLAMQARELIPEGEGGAYMLVFTSRSHGLELRSPTLSTISCSSTTDVKALVEAHVVAYNAHAGLYSPEEFTAAMNELLLGCAAVSEAVRSRIQLLLGWTAAVALADAGLATRTIELAQRELDASSSDGQKSNAELAEAMLNGLEGIAPA